MRFLLCVLAIVVTAVAQSAPGPTVAVTDENGVAVVSARVVVESATTTVAHCETDFRGRCQFPSLAAGAYKLRIEKEGFYALEQPDVQMAPGSTVEVSISRQQEVKEVVDVRESPLAIDPAQVTAKETMSGLDVVNMVYPGTHDYRNVLNFIPGVVADQTGQPHVAGAQTYQTLTLLDGFNVTQPANGRLVVRVSADAFRSIEVEPSREPAEQGKGSGGVLSLNTGIGDDHFRFFATNFLPSVQNKHGWRFDQFLPRFTFSGPLARHKMWFYNAFEGEYSNLVFNGLPAGADNDHIFRVGDLFKIQTNLTSRDILTTSFLLNDLHDQYAYLSPQSPQLSNPKDVESAYVTSVKEQHYFAGQELLETGLAFAQYNLQLTPYGTSPYFVNSGTATVGATAGNSYYLTEQTTAQRVQGIVNLFLPAHQWHGRHDFKIGSDLDWISYRASFARQPISFLTGSSGLTSASECATAIQDPSFPCTRYSTFGPAPLHNQYDQEMSAYVEDRWSLTNRLLIEPGARVDWDGIVHHVRASPRLAGTYVLDESGNTKLSAGIGIVYDATPIYLIARPFAGTRQDIFYTINPQCTPTNPNCSPAVFVTGPVHTTFHANTDELEVPHFLNWSVGLEKKLPKAIYLKAEFMRKRGAKGFVYNALGPTTDFFLQNTREDHYDALQFTVRHNFRENYTIMGAYTRSSARSNEALDFSVDSPVLSGQQPGPYAWDAPNRFLSWGYLPFFKLPVFHQLELAYSMEARSGYPFSLLNDQQQLIGKPGAQRFPEYFALNIQLEKRFRLLGYNLALRGGFDNITARCDAFVVNNVVDAAHPTPTFSACLGRAFTSRIRLLGRK